MIYNDLFIFLFHNFTNADAHFMYLLLSGRVCLSFIFKYNINIQS